MKYGLVISDLHLLAPRSDGERLVAQWTTELHNAEVLVLNGDTFDFRWSRMGGEERSIGEATRWLRQLLEDFRGRELHYVLGNHDSLAGFRARLERMTGELPALHCHELRLRLGRSLFLHGDCANRRMSAALLSRSREAWSRDRPRGRLRGALYHAADAAGITRRFHRWHFPAARSAHRVAHYLDDAMPGWRDEIDDCYFGHTHVPFRGHAHDGVRFHNTGSGIRGMGFQPLRFEVLDTPENEGKES